MAEHPFQIFAKPVGARCNLSCGYCYYLDKSILYSPGLSVMTDDLLEKYITQHIQATTEDVIAFSWHGGEPLLAGIDFYKKALKIQEAHKPEGKTILNGIQTNGSLISEEWCRFFSESGFIIGLSIDGPEELHNNYRLTRNNQPSWKAVMNGFHLLMKHGVIPELLCVVNDENVKHPREIYNFFRKCGVKFITFLPIVERIPQTCTVTKKSVNALEFGHFLSEIFDAWVEDGIGHVKIQIIEEAARTAFNQEHTLCIFKENCGGVPVVEQNGDFYSCDHFVDDKHLIGNILTDSLDSLLDSNEQSAFGLSKSKSLPRYCKDCEVFAMCNGECPKNRFILTPGGEPGLNYLCEGYKYFFNHCRPFVESIRLAYGSISDKM